ncbi:hypothetical protein AALO_G00017810 [Alosa alosa]|uniref:Secreted protein n=1 Tax=Alosa alosa TaxID=278164 RepID=A0AAV6HHH7_9TELE|nr:hypothetical protein AALO_G00017810 [Alosa alosa]
MRGALPLPLMIALVFILTQCAQVHRTANGQPIMSEMASLGIVSKLEERSTVLGATAKDWKTPLMSFMSRKRRSSISRKPFCAGCFSVIGDPTTTHQ